MLLSADPRNLKMEQLLKEKKYWTNASPVLEGKLTSSGTFEFKVKGKHFGHLYFFQ